MVDDVRPLTPGSVAKNTNLPSFGNLTPSPWYSSTLNHVLDCGVVKNQATPGDENNNQQAM